MMIQVLLVSGFALCLVYAYLQRHKSHLISSGIAAVSAVAIYFVLHPERANDLAAFFGVGRGTDLVLYAWLLISFFVSVNLQFKILKLQGSMTQLVRAVALQAASVPQAQIQGPGDGQGPAEQGRGPRGD